MTPRLRTLLILGRVSNLPTVWSDCFAGWWLGGGGNFWKLPFLLLGVSALYTGGSFLNDAFDEEFDRQRRIERPIPSVKISVALVWQLGLGQLALGILLLLFCGKVAAGAAVFLALFILLYDWIHKFLNISPWIMGACRFWVYVVAGATSLNGLNGWPIYCGAALAFYTVGLNSVAQRGSFRKPVPIWPLSLLAAPVILALLMNTNAYRISATWISAILILWIAQSVRTIFSGETNVRLVAANLLAGIVLVDWLAVAPQIPQLTSVLFFLPLFGLTKWFQKIVPST